MSHRVTIDKTDIRDAEVVTAACKRLNLDAPVAVTDYNLGINVTGNVSGLKVQFKAREGEKTWVKPVVFDVTTGDIHYDNWNGVWGNFERMTEFTDAYAVEAIYRQARYEGSSVVEETLADGSIELAVHHLAGV